jgi:hypothetical protein
MHRLLVFRDLPLILVTAGTCEVVIHRSVLLALLYATTFIKFDKIWLFFDLSGAGQRGFFLRKRAAWVSEWCPEQHRSPSRLRREPGSTQAG